MTKESLAEVAAELAAISERLDDLALEELRSAVEQGAGKRPDAERRIVRARNSIDRARRILEDG